MPSKVLGPALLSLGLLLGHGGAAAEPLEVSSIGRRLNVEDWSQTRLGRLAWRGGLELTSPSKDFGGFSGLLIEQDGRRLLAVTDRGMWLRAELDYDEDGFLEFECSAGKKYQPKVSYEIL